VTASALRLVDTAGTTGPVDGDQGWLEWLVDHVELGWRRGEWDHGLWLFTGDLDSDRTVGWACRTPSCRGLTRRHDARCDTCRHAQTAEGSGDDAFDRQPRRRPFFPLVPEVCSVAGCERDRHSRGLCVAHDRAWDKRRASGEPFEEFVVHAEPLDRLEACLVAACGREQASGPGLCPMHTARLRRQRGGTALSAEALSVWADAQPPRLGAHQFSLAGLQLLVRFEVLYTLQRRDETRPPIDAMQVRVVAGRLAGAASVRHVDLEALWSCGGLQYNATAKGLARDVGRHIGRAWCSYTGQDPCAGDVWDLGLLDLQANGSRRHPVTAGVVDFRPIGLGWLRELTKQWATASRPYLQTLRQAVTACRVAGHALAACGHTDPTRLGTGDFARIVDAICSDRRANGGLPSVSYRNVLVYRFCEVIDHGRTAGLMSEVPDTFCRAKRPRLVEDPNEDELGKALPDTVIRQLDGQLELLGPAGRFGPIAAGDLKAMHHAIYRILRDTGRRPGEVVSLKVGCVEVIDGAHNLIYDNHKAGRMRRRLPITAATAAIIEAWHAHRAELLTPPSTAQWLFPSPVLRSPQALGHLTSACIGVAFRTWVRQIPVIDGELLGPDGTPSPFDRSLIAPYALRHSYAQRHADAGVPVDVLRELMDHVSVQTTMGYYSVSLKRKAQAIRSVGSLAIDAAGRPSPFGGPLAYERASVSVPFGNCTEPSNVKAGGGSCPIRFQCAGCGFYRPDPSYLPALDEHVASLRADRETAMAMDAAEYVVANLSAEINAFNNVADIMRSRLADLGPEERGEVEAASRLLRRARAARRVPVVASDGQTA
jgi:integrase